MPECHATSESKAVHGHTHTCIGQEHHDSDGSHFCGECRMWWWRKFRARRAVPPKKKRA